MSSQTLQLDERLYGYLLKSSLRETAIQKELRAKTASHPWANMQICPEQGQFMALLVKMLGAKKIIELGVFTGYSSLAMAMALPEDGKIIACDVSEEYTNTAKHYWHKAGVSEKIELILAPALVTLSKLLEQGAANSFDFIFIDAVKEEYTAYYQEGYKLLRQGGVIAVDNVLWNGAVADLAINDSATEALRKFNQLVLNDERVDLSMVPIGDGLTLIRKR